MGRQSYDLQLTRYAEQGWRANFYPAGIAHLVVCGNAWAVTPGGGACPRLLDGAVGE